MQKKFFIALLLAAHLTSFSPHTSVHADTSSQEAPVTVDLIADVSQVQPGIPFRLGVYFSIPKPWHIYWKNPGDSGLPTKITFTSPQGTYLHDLRWPLPVRFVQPGNIVGFGYEKNTLLMTEVTPPSEIKEDTFQIKADIRWLNCSTFCVRGKAEKILTLPVRNYSIPANEVKFKEETYPYELHDVAPALDLKVTSATPELIELDLTQSNKIEEVNIFPYVAEGKVGSPTMVVRENNKSAKVKVPLSKIPPNGSVEIVVTSITTGRAPLGATLSVQIPEASKN